VKNTRATKPVAPAFSAALAADSVGVGLLSAIFLFSWLSARHLNLFVELWLTVNVFVLGGLVCLLAVWIARFAIQMAAAR
jgi:hypothetical protein